MTKLLLKILLLLIILQKSRCADRYSEIKMALISTYTTTYTANLLIKDAEISQINDQVAIMNSIHPLLDKLKKDWTPRNSLKYIKEELRYVYISYWALLKMQELVSEVHGYNFSGKIEDFRYFIRWPGVNKRYLLYKKSVNNYEDFISRIEKCVQNKKEIRLERIYLDVKEVYDFDPALLAIEVKKLDEKEQDGIMKSITLTCALFLQRCISNIKSPVGISNSGICEKFAKLATKICGEKYTIDAALQYRQSVIKKELENVAANSKVQVLFDIGEAFQIAKKAIQKDNSPFIENRRDFASIDSFVSVLRKLYSDPNEFILFIVNHLNQELYKYFEFFPALVRLMKWSIIKIYPAINNALSQEFNFESIKSIGDFYHMCLEVQDLIRIWLDVDFTNAIDKFKNDELMLFCLMMMKPIVSFIKGDEIDSKWADTQLKVMAAKYEKLKISKFKYTPHKATSDPKIKAEFIGKIVKSFANAKAISETAKNAWIRHDKSIDGRLLSIVHDITCKFSAGLQVYLNNLTVHSFTGLLGVAGSLKLNKQTLLDFDSSAALLNTMFLPNRQLRQLIRGFRREFGYDPEADVGFFEACRDKMSHRGFFEVARLALNRFVMLANFLYKCEAEAIVAYNEAIKNKKDNGKILKTSVAVATYSSLLESIFGILYIYTPMGDYTRNRANLIQTVADNLMKRSNMSLKWEYQEMPMIASSDPGISLALEKARILAEIDGGPWDPKSKATVK